MKKEKLQRITDGLVQGGNSGAPNGNNLIGAVNTILNLLEPIEQYDSLTLSDLSQEEQTALEEAQKDLQWHVEELGVLLGDFTANDGSVTLPSGESISLPLAATKASTTADLPNVQ